MVLGWPGIVGDKDRLRNVVNNWGKSPRLAFVDAYLAVRATSESRVIFSKNIRELVRQGATVPDPLPETDRR